MCWSGRVGGTHAPRIRRGVRGGVGEGVGGAARDPFNLQGPPSGADLLSFVCVCTCVCIYVCVVGVGVGISCMCVCTCVCMYMYTNVCVDMYS